MLLLVTGASGVGKSSARVGATTLLDESFEAIELWHLGPIPAVPTIEWRQQMAERAALRAIELDAEGRHLLLAGDPMAAGEILAAPSADQVDVAVCLLDVNEAAHQARLDARNEPADLVPLHFGFAAWMRKHATDPSHLQVVLTNGGWDQMRWDRWMSLADGDPRWAMTVINTSDLAVDEVAVAVSQWCRDAVAGRVPVFRRGWSQAV